MDALLRAVNFLALEQSNRVVFSKFDISIVSSSNAYHLSQLKYLRSVRRVISVDIVKPSLPDQGVASSAEAVAVGVIFRTKMKMIYFEELNTFCINTSYLV